MADIAWWQQGLLQLGSTVAGGLIAVGSTVYQMKYITRMKMAEHVAERKVQANQEAYSRIKIIAAMLAHDPDEKTLAKMMEYEPWFFDTRLFLPGAFPNKWLGIRNGLRLAIRKAERGTASPEVMTGLNENLIRLTGDAIHEIYKEMNLRKLSPHNPGEPELTAEDQDKLNG